MPKRPPLSMRALLSRPLGKSIFAEGIKTPDQAWMLKAHGLQAQLGFHLGRSMTVGEVLAYLDVAHARLPGLVRA